MSAVARPLSSTSLEADTGLASSFQPFTEHSTTKPESSASSTPIAVIFMPVAESKQVPNKKSPSTRSEQGKHAGPLSTSGLAAGSARETTLKRHLAAKQAGETQLTRALTTPSDSTWPYVVVLPLSAVKGTEQNEQAPERSMLDSDDLSETLSAAARTAIASKKSASGADLLAASRSHPQARSLLGDASWLLLAGNILGNHSHPIPDKMRISTAVVFVALASSARLSIAQPVNVLRNGNVRDFTETGEMLSKNKKVVLLGTLGLGFLQSITRRDDLPADQEHLADPVDILKRIKSDVEDDPSHGREPPALSARHEGDGSPIVVMLVPPPGLSKEGSEGGHGPEDAGRAQEHRLHRRSPAAEAGQLVERGALMKLMNAGMIAWAVGDVGGHLLKKLLHLGFH
ncbi:hypothetical protein OC846_003825 [Tilletia horrida]|uniref:Uncharacterized protein n=1 Tax=Tilletia horrida TaxID=155126 RepID=A0AAN6GPB4_9BASI|nr:hypothetical protein OC846_003825 [Tilletia horrida]KAK0565086.1 hypothetical protein OC861_003946 [Tilletia horrida]